MTIKIDRYLEAAKFLCHSFFNECVFIPFFWHVQFCLILTHWPSVSLCLSLSLSSNWFFRFLSIYLTAQPCLGVTNFKPGLEILISVVSSKYFTTSTLTHKHWLNSLIIHPTDVNILPKLKAQAHCIWLITMSICIRLHYCFKCLIWSKSEDISTFCCIFTYLNNALLITPINGSTVLKSPRVKRSSSAILIRNNCYFDCSFCWLGLHVQTGLISHIPPLIKLDFIVMGYFLFFYFFLPFLLYCCCLYRKACFKAYYCIDKIICKITYN